MRNEDMQQLSEQIKTQVSSCESKAFDLKAHMIKLETVQAAVAQLLERIEDIQHKGWDKELGMAHFAIGEIEQTVRLIDMAFYPLFKVLYTKINDTNEKI